MGQVLHNVSTVCDRTETTLVLVHHARKNSVANYDRHLPLELDAIAWAGFQEFARQWMLLSRRETYDPGSGAHRLWMSVGGSVGHGGLYGVDVDEGVYDSSKARTWSVNVQSPADIRQSREEQKAANKEAETVKRLPSESPKGDQRPGRVSRGRNRVYLEG